METNRTEIRFRDRGIVEFDNVRVIFKNFEGKGDKYNREGDRNFAISIQDEEIASALKADKNKFGVGWNVKTSDGRDDFYLPVKVKFTDYGPAVYLIANGKRIKLNEETISMLDNIYFSRVDLDIRPYDDVISGKPFRAAYLQSMRVVQDVTDRFSEEEYPEEMPFN